MDLLKKFNLDKYRRMPEFGENYAESLFLYNTPDIFHTYRAFDLFTIATAAGLFSWNNTMEHEECLQWITSYNHRSARELEEELAQMPHKLVPVESGPIKTQAHLAYWCIRASAYLGLDRGRTTSWEPFENLFGLPSRSLSRATGPLDLEYNEKGIMIGKREEYTAEIDNFFASLENALNGGQPQPEEETDNL